MMDKQMYTRVRVYTKLGTVIHTRSFIPLDKKSAERWAKIHDRELAQDFLYIGFEECTTNPYMIEKLRDENYIKIFKDELQEEM